MHKQQPQAVLLGPDATCRQFMFDLACALRLAKAWPTSFVDVHWPAPDDQDGRTAMLDKVAKADAVFVHVDRYKPGHFQPPDNIGGIVAQDVIGLNPERFFFVHDGMDVDQTAGDLQFAMLARGRR